MNEFTIRDVTVKDRMLLHLARFPYISPGQEYEIPFDLTQDGVASVCGITRSHASIDLKRLYEVGMVTFWQAHLKGGKSRRLVYAILPPGLEKAKEIRSNLEKNGIDPDSVLDMKKCDPQIKWKVLNEQDRDTFGKVCVMRVPVERGVFPPTTTGVVPADIFGVINLAPETARLYLEKLPAEEVRKWNSWAADWWLEKGNVQERLYHLIEAGRMTEACRTVIRHMEEFSGNPNEDLLELLDKLEPSPSQRHQIISLMAETAVECRRFDVARRILVDLSDDGSPYAALISSRLDLVNNQYAAAFDKAQQAFGQLGCVSAAVVMSKACIRADKLREADENAVKAIAAMHEKGDASQIEDILLVRAEIAHYQGKKTETLALLGKALIAAPDYKKGLIEDITKAVEEDSEYVKFP